MRIITSINEMREYSRGAKKEGRTIALVPTMGYLHEGHLGLVRAARSECDIVVVSVFVNPAQFLPGEDFEKYPRDMKMDSSLAEKEGVDVIFAPSAGEMYPANFSSYVEVTGPVAETLCARSRPGHFKGVTTVVMKLFDIVSPAKSYFGEKDAQQAVIIKKMVKELNVPVEISVLPIVREKDGLAMSSRNEYLSESERQKALNIFKALKTAEGIIQNGERDTGVVKKNIKETLLKDKGIKIDYVEVVNADSLEPLEIIEGSCLIAVAVFIGKVRLIDNVIVERQNLQ